MGLIGFVVAPLCFGVSVVFIPTLRFLRDPTVWMETSTASRHDLLWAELRLWPGPEIGAWSPAMQRASVVLPLPLSPTTARQRPAARSNETSLTAISDSARGRAS